ncbi:MAG: DUF1501 domain-containing protein, partial [Verrucomicrobiota bacterium]
KMIRRARMNELPDGYDPTHWEFKPGGQSGIMVSDLFPNVRECMDDICVINSMTTDKNDHAEATLGLHTGSYTVKRPSLGSWVSYGLGTENANLTSFVVIAPSLPYYGATVWDANFLPGIHTGTRIVPGSEPVSYLNRKLPADQQLQEFEYLREFNRLHQNGREETDALAARIRSFETAFGMQNLMPEITDVSRESDSTLGLYGLKRGQNDGFGWQCLVARRMAERGVRFIELIDKGNWDSHSKTHDHEKLSRNVDQPLAGLLRDLKMRGMLDDTLVVWTTEFGRTPRATGKGRGHHRYVFSSWLAGGGIKGGTQFGSSDEFGEQVAENPVHVHDLHATILHQLGFNHERLTFRHAGRDFRLTDVHGRVVKEILA